LAGDKGDLFYLFRARALRIIILGSGSPLPCCNRVQSGFLLEEASKLLVIDCGSGVLYRLGELGIDLRRVENVLLTHHHLDHLSDLLPLLKARWLLGSTKTTIYGPEGTESLLLGLLSLFPYLNKAVTLDVVELKGGEGLEVEGIDVKTIEAMHLIPTLAYKFDDKIVISGDTEPSPEIGDFAEGCELLLHECSLPDDLDVPGHSTPTKLGQALAGHTIKALILVHLYPPASSKADDLVKQIREWFPGEVKVARDLDSFAV
jgi:ribonuclease BN (tRNA processing enzyme)